MAVASNGRTMRCVRLAELADLLFQLLTCLCQALICVTGDVEHVDGRVLKRGRRKVHSRSQVRLVEKSYSGNIALTTTTGATRHVRLRAHGRRTGEVLNTDA